MGRERGEGKGRRLAALVSKERKEKEKVVRARFASWLLKPLHLFPPLTDGRSHSHSCRGRAVMLCSDSLHPHSCRGGSTHCFPRAGRRHGVTNQEEPTE